MALPDKISIDLEIYKSLRSEMIEQIKETYNIEKLAFAGVLAASVWLLTNGHCLDGSIRRVAWLVPLLVSTLGFFRSVGIFIRMKSIAGHLLSIEREISLEYSVIGWERYLRGDKQSTVPDHDASAGRAQAGAGWIAAHLPTVISFVFWALLIAGSVFLALVYAHTDKPMSCVS